MNYYEHHLGDYIRDAGHLSMLEEGAYRRLLDAYYVREKPLPHDLKECCKLARASTAAERKAVGYVIGQFFRRDEDGYHQKRADEQIAEYIDGEPEREQKRENDKERKRRSRERRRTLFEELREVGITMPFDATIADLEARLSQDKSRVTGNKMSQHVTRDGTASQSPVPNPQSPIPRLQTPEPPSKSTHTPEVSSPVRARKDPEKGSVCGTFKKVGGEKPSRNGDHNHDAPHPSVDDVMAQLRQEHRHAGK